MSLAEKFQITVPFKEKEGDSWVSAKSARKTECTPTSAAGSKFNEMPVGYQIEEKNPFAHGFGGDTDVTGGITPQSLVDGFHKKPMKGTDDQYTGEHVDLFYGDAGGFVERNNYLDRE
jgi:hypothetical protein